MFGLGCVRHRLGWGRCVYRPSVVFDGDSRAFFACRGLSRWGGGAAQVRRGLFGVGCAGVVLGGKFGEYGLDGEPLHGGEAASS